MQGAVTLPADFTLLQVVPELETGGAKQTTLDVARDDVDGTIHHGALGQSSLVLFDAVPGGAGHVQRLGARLAELIRAASMRVTECECGPETSCYACLRSYANQIWHQELSRESAIRLLEGLQR